MLDAIYFLGGLAYLGSRVVAFWQARETSVALNYDAPMWLKLPAFLLVAVVMTALWPLSLLISIVLHFTGDKKDDSMA